MLKIELILQCNRADDDDDERVYLIFAEVVNSARQDCRTANFNSRVSQWRIERRLFTENCTTPISKTINNVHSVLSSTADH